MGGTCSFNKKQQSWVFLLLFLLIDCECVSVQHRSLHDEGFKDTEDTIVSHILDNVSPFWKSFKEKSLLFHALHKLRRSNELENFKKEILNLLQLQTSWRGVNEITKKAKEPTYYHRLTTWLGLFPIKSEKNDIDLSKNPTKSSHDNLIQQDEFGMLNSTGTTNNQPHNEDYNQGNQNAAVSTSSRGSIALNEAQLVPALCLMWLGIFFYGSAKNVWNSTGSSTSGPDPPGSGDLSYETKKFSSMMPIKLEGRSNRSLCLSGNLFFGFGVTSLLLAIWFAPTAYRARLLTAAFIVLGGNHVRQQDDDPVYQITEIN